MQIKLQIFGGVKISIVELLVQFLETTAMLISLFFFFLIFNNINVYDVPFSCKVLQLTLFAVPGDLPTFPCGFYVSCLIMTYF